MKLMLSKPNRSTADYLFEKAERYFCRARANLNARVALEAVGNAFMVKAIELDIKLSRPKAATPSNRLGTDAATADKLLADGSKY
ncbi:MAG: hypothetical protein WAV78_35965 [Xanthobacteraceae bacterium]